MVRREGRSLHDEEGSRLCLDSQIYQENRDEDYSMAKNMEAESLKFTCSKCMNNAFAVALPCIVFLFLENVFDHCICQF